MRRGPPRASTIRLVHLQESRASLPRGAREPWCRLLLALRRHIRGVAAGPCGRKAVAKHLYDYYRRELYENVAGRTGVSVLHRSESNPATNATIGTELT